MTDEQTGPAGTPEDSSAAVDAPALPSRPRPRPRRALAAPGRLPPEAIERHAHRLRGVDLPPETPEQAAVRRGRRRDVEAAMESLRVEGAPAQQRPRADLSEILDRLGSPDLARFTAPLIGTVERILPTEPFPVRSEAARRRQAQAEARRRLRHRAERERSAEAARRRAEEEARREEAAAALADAAARTAAQRVEAARVEEERRAERERERRAAEERRRAEQAAQEQRRRRASELARRRREEERARQRREAERRRRRAEEERERAAAERRAREEAEAARAAREAEAAVERARVQAERRAREETEAAERERARAAAEAERRRRAAEAAEAERRRAAEEAERARREAEEAARAASEARRRHREHARRYAAHAADRALAQARGLEERRQTLAARRAEEEVQRLRAHQERETRALMVAARELDGPELVPPADARPALSSPGEDVTDEELLARARAVLPEWRRRGRLATKAAAVQALSGSTTGAPAPAAGSRPLIPGYTPPAGEPEPRRRATAADRGRQLLVTAAYALFVLAGAWGMGLFRRVPGLSSLHAGTYRGAHGGRYGAGTTVFSLFPLDLLVWPVLWVVLGVYVLHQWAPGQGGATRQRRTGRSAAGALGALALWFPLAVLVPWGLEWVAWAAALVLAVRVILRLTRLPARTRGSATATDGPLGVLLGVLLAGAPTTLAAALAAWGVDLPWFPTELVAELVLLAVLVVGARLVLTDRGRMGVALGLAGTLLCLALPRLLPSPLGAQQSAWVGQTAVFGGLLLVLVAAARRSWVHQVERDAA